MFKRTGLTLLFFAFIAVALIKVFGAPDWLRQPWDRLLGNSDSTAVVASDSTQAPVIAPPSAKRKVASGNAFAKIDAHALATPAAVEGDIDSLAAYLTVPAKNELEKARAIFRWITDRIAYDDAGYNSKNYGKADAESVLYARNGVCGDYAMLFKAMGEAAGLEVEDISGLSKGISYQEGGSMGESRHAWNAVKINGKWRLFDATWGAGHGNTVDGQLKSTKDFTPHWFDVDPSAFVLTHLPTDPQWQLLDQPLTQQELERMPRVELELFDIGFSPTKVLKGLRATPMVVPPKAWNHDLPIRDFKGPNNKFVKVGEPIEFSFRCATCQQAAVVQNNEWTYLKESKGIWKLRFTPQPGEFSLVASEKGNLYGAFLEYLAKRVVGPAS